MEIEIMTASSSLCNTPYLSAASSPNHNQSSFFYSAPTSPNHVSKISFEWEPNPSENPPPKKIINSDQEEDEIDFEFDFSGQLEKGSSSLPADELFHGGQIKPLNNNSKTIHPPIFSKPFEAMKENDKRGRERTINMNNSRNKGSSRSVSPYRVSDLLIDPEFNQEVVEVERSTKRSSSLSFSSFWYKKWKIKDLLLFRSASESRATDEEEQMKKYELLKKAREEENGRIKNLRSFRSTDQNNMSKRKSVSAHEIHYTENRAASEEMKKRTYLPYKRGLLGCLGFQQIPGGLTSSLSVSVSVSRG